MRIFSLQNVVLFLALSFLCSSGAQAAERYWVFFRDKGRYEQWDNAARQKYVRENLSARAQQRRLQRGDAAFRKSSVQRDLPLEENYLKILREMNFQIKVKSGWFNAVSGSADAAVLEQISGLPFVQSVERVKGWKFAFSEAASSPVVPFGKNPPPAVTGLDYGNSTFQIEFHNIDKLHDAGLSGRGVIVAMFDTGFQLDVPALQHVRQQLIAEYDFIQDDTVTSNQAGDATSQQNHGTLTLSVLGGFLPGKLIGPAYDASFLLAKTEIVDREIHLEEDYWAAAAQWAEARGADVVSSSLGYSEFDPGQINYTYQDMNGETTIITRAANILGQLGVLVVNSAGNEGSSSWHYITAPADGRQVLAVGALNSSNETAAFSSRGPTSDGRIKPDVSALGVNVYGATPKGGYTYASGTSLSCPLTAGICAQILEGHPALNVTQMLAVMRGAGDTAANPDNDRGWGRVDAEQARLLAANIAPNPPEEFRAYPPYPNPSFAGRQGVIFPVDLPEAGRISLEIYTVLGQKLKQIQFSGAALRNPVRWDLTNSQHLPVAAGLYIYRISSETGSETGKIVVLN